MELANKVMPYLPYIMGIWNFLMLVICYLTAVFLKHADPVIPFISDIGAKSPEREVFSWMFGMSRIIGLATIYTRYSMVEAQNQEHKCFNPIYNKLALGCGVLFCIALNLVALFPMQVILMHRIAALIFYVGAVFYTILQTIISYKIRATCNNSKICHLRLVISIIAFVALLAMVVFGGIRLVEEMKNNKPFKQIILVEEMKNNKAFKQDYIFRLISTASEWIGVIAIIGYIVTFGPEFQWLNITVNISTKKELPESQAVP